MASNPLPQPVPLNTVPNQPPNQFNLPQVEAGGTPLGVDPDLWAQYMATKNGQSFSPVNALGGMGGLGGLGGADKLRAGGFGSGISHSWQPQLSSSQMQWMKMMDDGRNAVMGEGRLPFMFSNYGGVPTDYQQALKQFFPNANLTAPTQAGAQTTANLGMPQQGDQSSPLGIDFSQFNFPDQMRTQATTMLATNPNLSKDQVAAQLQQADKAMLASVIGGNGAQPGAQQGA